MENPGGAVAVPKNGTPWKQDTVSIVFSCTKGATALCAHILASRGKLDLDAPVVELWPEFGQHGKQGVTTRMMLDHSAGVPALRAKIEGTAVYDWSYMTKRLADDVTDEEKTRRIVALQTLQREIQGEVYRQAIGREELVLVESRSRPALQAFLARWVAAIRELKAPKALRWHIDVDPLEF